MSFLQKMRAAQLMHGTDCTCEMCAIGKKMPRQPYITGRPGRKKRRGGPGCCGKSRRK